MKPGFAQLNALANDSRKWLRDLTENFHCYGTIIFSYKYSRRTVRIKHGLQLPKTNNM